jgi:hypothetical protein
LPSREDGELQKESSGEFDASRYARFTEKEFAFGRIPYDKSLAGDFEGVWIFQHHRF